MTQDMPFSLTVNGEVRAFEPAPQTVAELVKALGLENARIAVELNRRIVTRAKWADATIQANDIIELVHFVGGGS